MEKLILPRPVETGATLLRAVELRRTQRNFVDRPMSRELIGELLWYTAGCSHPEGKFTYPTARDRREITTYLFTSEGVWKYDAADHALLLLREGDFRMETGTKEFVGAAALNLVFVADHTIEPQGERHRQQIFSAIAVGAMSQNGALCAAAHNLGSVVRGMYDAQKIAALLQLPADCEILLTQSIGPIAS